jgi:hypothetical protein
MRRWCCSPIIGDTWGHERAFLFPRSHNGTHEYRQYSNLAIYVSCVWLHQTTHDYWREFAIIYTVEYLHNSSHEDQLVGWRVRHGNVACLVTTCDVYRLWVTLLDSYCIHRSDCAYQPSCVGLTVRAQSEGTVRVQHGACTVCSTYGMACYGLMCSACRGCVRVVCTGLWYLHWATAITTWAGVFWKYTTAPIYGQGATY